MGRIPVPATGAELLQPTEPACTTTPQVHSLAQSCRSFESWLLSAVLHAELLFSADYCPSSWALHTVSYPPACHGAVLIVLNTRRFFLKTSVGVHGDCPNRSVQFWGDGSSRPEHVAGHHQNLLASRPGTLPHRSTAMCQITQSQLCH